MASPAPSLERVEPGLIVRPRRGAGRRWQVGGPASDTSWRLFPLGPDIGSWSGVKPITVSTERLLSSWVLA